LCNPSGGYAATGPVPISVAPEIRLTIRSEQSSDGAYQNQITVHGTVPGLSYGLDFAEDSNFRWYQREGRVATGSTMLFRSIQPSVKQGFFRVRRL
jgi:hypothetical protein